MNHISRHIIANYFFNVDATVCQSFPQGKGWPSISTAKIDDRDRSFGVGIPLGDDINEVVQCGFMVELLKVVRLRISPIKGFLFCVEFQDFFDSLGEEGHIKERRRWFEVLLSRVGVEEEISEHQLILD